MGGKSAAAKYSQMKWHIDNREDWGKDDWKDDQNNSGWDGGKNAGWQAGGTVVGNGKCRARGHIRAAVQGKSAAVKYSQMQWPKDKPEGWGKYDREHDENNSGGRGDGEHGGWKADSTGGGNCNEGRVRWNSRGVRGGSGKAGDGTATRLYVAQLPGGISSAMLEDIFKDYGNVTNVHLMTQKAIKGCIAAFVDYSSPEECDLAILALDQKYEIRTGIGVITVKHATDARAFSSYLQKDKDWGSWSDWKWDGDWNEGMVQLEVFRSVG